MGFLDNVLKVFVGDKSKKDLGDIQPYVEQVKSHEAALEKLSIDELRAKSDVFRNIIKEDQKEIQDEIDALIVAADKEEDIDKKEDTLSFQSFQRLFTISIWSRCQILSIKHSTK